MPARFADRPRPRGAWSNSTAYLRGDLVSFDGRTWIALAPSTNVEPVAGNSWAVFADRGEQGERGLQGEQGAQGSQGIQGVQGTQGAQGASGIVSVTAPITNSGTTSEAIIGITTGTANGVAPLDSNAKVPSANLPALAITDTFVVASQTAMLALTAEVGDVAIRTDLSKSYILASSPATTLSNWQEILAPPDSVVSVNGQTGAVSLTASDVGAATSVHTHSQSDITNLTSDLAAKAPIANPTFTGTATIPTLNVTGNTTISGSLEGHKVIIVGNNTGSTITKGSAVYINGATGDNARIALAQANAESTSSKTLGLAYEDIPNGSTTGKVLTEGYLDGIDTSNAAAAGDAVWLSPTTAGGLVYGLGNKPSAPNHLVFIGVVARKQQNNGRIFVKVQNGFELDELHTVDLNTNAPSNGQVLTYDSSTSLWKNQTITQSQVTNLTTDLAGKAPTSHTHTLSQITDAGAAASKAIGTTAGTVAAGDHTHTLSAVTDFTTRSGAAISSTNRALDQFSDVWAMTRSSEAYTVPRQIATSSTTLANRTLVGGRAYVRATKSYTKIRAATGATAGSGLTAGDIRLIVFDTGGNIIGYTANLITGGGTTLAANTVYTNTITETSTGSMTLSAGSYVWLTVIGYSSATTPTWPNFLGGSIGNTILNSVKPELNVGASIAAGTWSGGTPTFTITSQLLAGTVFTAIMPWMELGFTGSGTITDWVV